MADETPRTKPVKRNHMSDMVHRIKTENAKRPSATGETKEKPSG